MKDRPLDWDDVIMFCMGAFVGILVFCVILAVGS